MAGAGTSRNAEDMTPDAMQEARPDAEAEADIAAG
jgi:hypothetical protein